MNDRIEMFKSIPNMIAKANEPLSVHSTMRVGGSAEIALFPKTQSALIEAIDKAFSENIEYRIIGNASNVVFPDDGLDGAVIFTEYLDKIDFSDESVTAECGVNLIYLSFMCAKRCLSGLEFACGIPASVGGAVCMNAGAYGQCIADVLSESKFYLPSENAIKTVASEEHGFSFRKSVFRQNGAVLLSSSFSLKKIDSANIERTVKSNKEKRRFSQPLEYPSAGSAFLPVNGRPAWEYIDAAGLRGYSIGGAQFSEKHAGFIINRGGATSFDISALVKKAQNTVFEKFGVNLETEIIFIN